MICICFKIVEYIQCQKFENFLESIERCWYGIWENPHNDVKRKLLNYMAKYFLTTVGPNLSVSVSCGLPAKISMNCGLGPNLEISLDHSRGKKFLTRHRNLYHPGSSMRNLNNRFLLSSDPLISHYSRIEPSSRSGSNDRCIS